MENLSLKITTPEHSHHYWACHFSLLTPKHRQVLRALCELEGQIIRGEKIRGEDSREHIAEKAKVSLRTVGNVIREHEGMFFTHKSERREEGCEHKPNEYYLQRHFLEFMALANLNNYLHVWKEAGPGLVEKLEKNDYFLVEKTMKKWKLSTMLLPTVWMLDLPTIKSYSSKLLLDKQRVDAFEQAYVHKSKEAPESKILWVNPILKNRGLDWSCQQWAMKHGVEKEIVEAIRACEYQEKRHKIPNLSAYFIGTLRNKMNQRVRR